MAFALALEGSRLLDLEGYRPWPSPKGLALNMILVKAKSES